MTKFILMIIVGGGLYYLLSGPSHYLGSNSTPVQPGGQDTVRIRVNDMIPDAILGSWADQKSGKKIKIIRNQGGYVLLSDQQFRRLRYEEGVIVGEACPHRFYEPYQKEHRRNKLCEIRILLLDPRTLVIDGVGKFVSIVPRDNG